MRFRLHRGGLEESLATTIEVACRGALLEAIVADAPFLAPVEDRDLTSEPQAFDPRTGWDTHMVLVRGLPVGFADAPLPVKPV